MAYTTATKVRQLIPHAKSTSPDDTAIEDIIAQAEATYLNPRLQTLWSVPVEDPDDLIMQISTFYSAGLLLMSYVRGEEATAQAEFFMDEARRLLDELMRNPLMVDNAILTPSQTDKSKTGVDASSDDPFFSTGDETQWKK